MQPLWNRFAVAYARALHAAGASTPDLEREVVRVLVARGLPATVMATPTALWVDLDGGARVLRVEPAAPDMARLVALHRLGDRVAEGLAVERALEALARIEASPGPWSPTAERVAFVVAGAAPAALLGGSGTDVLVAAALAGVVAALIERVRHPLAPFFAALAVSTLAQLAAAFGADPMLVGFSSLVVLAPGVTLTLAAAETAAGHLTSGTARFAGAVVTLVQLAAGLAVPHALVAAAPIAAPLALPRPLAVALVALAPVAIGVLHRIRAADLPWAVAVAGAAWVVALAAPGALGAGLAAFVTTVLSNAIAGRLRTPPAVYSAPALVLLVPGTMSVRGVGEILGQAVASGVSTALSAAIVAAALAAGMLIGQGLRLPAPRTAPAPRRGERARRGRAAA